MKNKFWLPAVLTIGLFQTAFGQTIAPQLEKGGYLIGPGDVITGRVLGESQFDFTATIGEDGKFQVPFFE